MNLKHPQQVSNPGLPHEEDQEMSTELEPIGPHLKFTKARNSMIRMVLNSSVAFIKVLLANGA